MRIILLIPPKNLADSVEESLSDRGRIPHANQFDSFLAVGVGPMPYLYITLL